MGKQLLNNHPPQSRGYSNCEPLIEWPADQAEPEKYYLSTLPETTALNDLVYAAHMRWRIERDYQDLKQDLGLSHYEGRGWRSFHDHATLSIAAYGFQMAQRLKNGSDAGGKKNFPTGRRSRNRSGVLPAMQLVEPTSTFVTL